MRQWRCVRMCIHDGRLTYPGEVIEADNKPSEHFTYCGGQPLEELAAQAGNKPVSGQEGENDKGKQNQDPADVTAMSKEQLIAFAKISGIDIDEKSAVEIILKAVQAAMQTK